MVVHFPFICLFDETSGNFIDSIHSFFSEFLQQFESIFRYNDPKVGGSYYLQCKSEHAKNVLHEELAREWEEEMAKQNAESDANVNGNDMNNNHKSEL